MIFITGGVRSGKSSYAEKRALQLKRSKGGRLHYVATSQVYDGEMRRRVELHEIEREKSGEKWHVHEKERHIEQLFSHFKDGDVILLDCVTTLVSNEYFVFSEAQEELWHAPVFLEEVEHRLFRLFNRLAALPCDVVIVSNEVFSDLPVEDINTVTYMRLLGKLHQHIVGLASEAIIVECKIPCWKKGEKKCLE